MQVSGSVFNSDQRPVTVTMSSVAHKSVTVANKE